MPVEKKSSKQKLKKDSGSKAIEKSKSLTKVTPGKSVKNPKKSTTKLLISNSKKGASSVDGASGSTPKTKVSASKKPKVDKESEKDQSAAAKEKGKNSKQSRKSTLNASARDQGTQLSSLFDVTDA